MKDEYPTEYPKPLVKILNLTAHHSTPSQILAGVIEPKKKGPIMELLNFDELPDMKTINNRATAIADIADKEKGDEKMKAMIGGAPFFMEPLANALRLRGIRPVFSFSRRESVEHHMPDGSVEKRGVFRHLGFVEL